MNLKDSFDWMANHERVFPSWLPNLKGIMLADVDKIITDDFKFLVEDIGIHKQCNLLKVDTLAFHLDLLPDSPWWQALAQFSALTHLQLCLSEPDADDLEQLCKSLPPTLKTFYVDWDSSEAFTLDEWSCFGQLKRLAELCIVLDCCEYTPETNPCLLSQYLSGLLPETSVLVSTW